ncbi:MAG: hypothetical protein M1433_00590 [Candidatus Parvarchaeota archaeon]|nr:hypothetical protein [Candidatus Parvarchaeota archaeon]
MAKYNKIEKQIRATLKNSYIVRLFYFSFSILLYNTWGVLNLLLMVCAGLDVLKRKAITLFSFLKKLYSVESG